VGKVGGKKLQIQTEHSGKVDGMIGNVGKRIVNKVVYIVENVWEG